MTRNILLAAASAGALLGCGNQPLAPAANADPRNPQVYVLNDGGRCAMTVDLNPLVFPNSGNGQAFPIIWHLPTGYKIVQNDNLPDPTPLSGSTAGVISGCRSGGLIMQCTNNNTARGKWKYDIRGVTSDSGGCNPPDLDPVINND